MIDPKLKNGIIIVVTSVWAVNFIAGLVVKTYEPDQAINAIFMGIVGGLFALGARGNDGHHKGSGSKPDSGSKDGEGPQEGS